jgi:hypothetical protein
MLLARPQLLLLARPHLLLPALSQLLLLERPRQLLLARGVPGMFAVHVNLSVSNPQLLLASLLLFLVRNMFAVAGYPFVVNTAPVACVPIRDVANLSWVWLRQKY